MREIEIHGHLFTFIGIEDYTRQDGSPTKLYRWRKQCEHAGCTKTWEFRTTVFNRGGDTVPPEHPSRHYDLQFMRPLCKKHRPKKTRTTSTTTYASRCKLTEEEVAHMRAFNLTHVGTRTSLYDALALHYGISPRTVCEILAGRKRKPRTI